MAKKQHKATVIAILLTVLTISSTYAILVPVSHADAMSSSTTEGLAIINQVAGIDLTKYTATPTLEVNGPSLGALPTENIQYSLAGNGSSIQILDSFANGTLQIMDVLENSGLPQSTSLPTNLSNSAKTFLLNYQKYSGNSFYGLLSSMLNNTNWLENSTTITGNKELDITTSTANSTTGISTTFTWSYTCNGIVDADKCISLDYQNGFLKDFINDWNFYPIGSTSVNLSEQQAEAIAMSSAKAYSWIVGTGNQSYLINKFNVTGPVIEQLMFGQAGNGSSVRSQDPLTLYPMWRIGIGLDKYYPGNVYGIYVDIWADTGKVRDVHEVFSTLPPPSGAPVATVADCSTSSGQAPEANTHVASLSSAWAIFAFPAVVMGVLIYFVSNRRSTFNASKLKFHKFASLMLCFLISSAAFFALISAMPGANAAVANIWGETTTGISGGVQYTFHTATEIQVQESLSSDITSWFGSAGYAANNYEYPGQTYVNNVLSDTYSADQEYPAVATVYFDHGVGMPGSISSPYQNEWHYMLGTDNTIDGQTSGNVFDWQIYSETSKGNNYFDFISTCHSASLWNGAKFGAFTGTYGSNTGGSGYIIGMPYAWTHGASLSSNGYANPDQSPYCYIGFINGSAALCQSVDNRPSGTSTYGMFVYDFFDDLLTSHLTVNQALDLAADQVFPPETFAGTALYQGFTAIWPAQSYPSGTQYNSTGWGQMAVYGNGNIYMYTGGPDYVSTPSISGPTSGQVNTQYQFSASATDPYGYALTYTFNWGDGSSPTVTNVPTGVSHTWASPNVYTITVTAQSQNGISSSSSTTISIGNVYQTEVNDYVTPNGNNWYYYGSYYITEPAGWNYLNFAGGLPFVQAYNFYDSTLHTANPDWYDLGTGTTISVGYWY